uniref:Uncharacterized protein n=1 Tax=Amphimedon queenslandica TaxID=400682 RepID=A0A1X7VWE4_AMPQE
MFLEDSLGLGEERRMMSLDEWYSMVGNSTDDRQLFISRDSGLGVSLPKHGKCREIKLQEIAMSEYDHNAFTQLRARIHKQVEMLKAILESTQSKSSERQWLRHQTDGVWEVDPL